MAGFSFERNRSVLFDGNVIVFATGTAERLNYQVRIKLPNVSGYAIRKSLKTSIEHEAIHLATEMYLNVRARSSQGISLLKMSWKELVQSFLEQKDSRSYRELWGATNRRYFSKFFGNVEDVETIDSEMIRKFWVWRQDYWTENPKESHAGIGTQKPTFVAIKPAYSSIQKEASYLRGILRYAFDTKKMPILPEVRHPYKAVAADNESHLSNRKRRASFTKKDYNRLTKSMGNLCSNHKDLRPFAIRAKEALRLGILLIANGLIRPTELYRVRFGQFELETIGEQVWTIVRLSKEQSKTNRPRVIAFEGGDNCFAYVQAFRQYAKWAEDDDLIMASDSDRHSARDLSWMFRKHTERLGISHDKVGRKRTLYSLRHYGIEQMLMRGTAPVVVAKLAGHSVATLVSFYDETSILMYLDQLNKNRTIYPKLDKEFRKDAATRTALKVVS
tara:strand:+ start:75 stop:1412 length:1338 start_codon:yes stop_codon:yes gene_type:complete